MPQQSLTVEHDQVHNKPLLSLKHTSQPTLHCSVSDVLQQSCTLYTEMLKHASYATNTEAQDQTHSLYTDTSTDTQKQNTDAQKQTHNSYSDTTQVPNRQIAHFSQQLETLISACAYQLDTKPCIPIR